MLTRLTGSASAETFTARVIGVTDGDTLTVLRVGRPEIIRLRGIDAPERGQAYGERAKQYAAALAFGKMVTVEAAGRDRYARLLGEVRLPDGRSLNQELVRAGYAWWFRRYSADPILAALEAEARAARRGLWADRDPRPPWDYRQRRNGLPGRSSGPRRPDRPGRPGARAGTAPDCHTWEARQPAAFRAPLRAIDACASRAALAALSRQLCAARLPRAEAGVAWTRYRIRQAALDAAAPLGSAARALLTAIECSDGWALPRLGAALYRRQHTASALDGAITPAEWRRLWAAYRARRPARPA